MLRQSSWVLESHVFELDLFLQLDSNASLGTFSVPDLGHSFDDVKDEDTQGFGSDQTLHVGKGSNQADEARDKRNQHREDIFLTIGLTGLAVDGLVLNQEGADVKRVAVEGKDGELHDTHHEAVHERVLLCNSVRLPRER